ncbi:nickel pincer cofactor biosynthesis protein LarC [Saliphagus infecundisoli]|uniref:Putative nickel insertion protein n=1 Tax=Saliphagus infecundisoli TaxID=1849069 RepID=A0ABD5QFC5_9EURY|nr:nickel pincer cofactor biosynthesis protein LarC [Saliphagus infecundisoli]
MRLLAFDGRSGASGDMVLGALLASGADPARLRPVEDALGAEYRIGSTTTCGIAATTVDVLLPDDGTDEDRRHDHDEGDENDHDHEHGHDHHHGDEEGGHDGHGNHDHAHGHEGDHQHGDADHSGAVPAEGHGPSRSYAEVVELVEDLELEPAIERTALAIFERLGRAEAAVHGTELDDTHFHEVGADDAIADVVGAAVLLADLDADRIVTTPLAVGGGTVSMSHGEYPVPAPAVVEIAGGADWTLKGGPVERELLTPTGAAILAEVAEGVESLPPIAVEASGYGAGSIDISPHPNALRVLVGETESELAREEIAVLETNVDDVSPEILGGLQDRLADVGARDVSIVPTTMKKSRPGHLVKVICKPEDRERVASRLARETGTLGVREAGASHRWIASRRVEEVALEIDGERYEVAVKVASDEDGAVYDVSAEYDDALAVARETGLAVREVLARAERSFDA